ncbi:iron ABC transporter permease [Rhodococcus sp. IEGM 1307]|uniref:ABC transporter permease n=1 Tax=Rhodococcus sp. IEGM 1307 TaxID=3047091 RepID=UPI0024B68240|nr:iron ABC transporter permease [Rhodococcus sp. IEGM 1307]MDI9979601.1 iron ABC transporter permease [Rhodococcus sp. IEGM 1307]
MHITGSLASDEQHATDTDTDTDHQAVSTQQRIGLVDRRSVQTTARRISALALVCIVGLLCLPPVYYVIDAALSEGGAGFGQMLEDRALGRTVQNTITLALGSVVISTVLGIVLAWGAQGLNRRNRWLGYIPLIPLVMPALAAVTGFGYLLNPTIGFGNILLRKVMFWSDSQTGPFDINTVPFILIVTATLLTSFVYLFVRSTLSQLDQGVYDAAAASGASPTRAFFLVILPLLRPAIVYSSLTVMLLALGQFAVPLFLGRQQNLNVLSTAMYISMSSAPPNIPLAAAYGLPIIVTGIAFLAIQRIVLRDQDRFASTGTKGAARALNKSGWFSHAALVAYGLFAVAAPILCVAVVAFQPYWSKDIVISEFTLENFRAVFANPRLTDAIGNTAVYSLTATAVAVPVGYLCAKILYARRQQKVIANIIDVLVSMSLGIPAVIFGVGFLLAYTHGPLNLYGRGAGLVIVYLVVTLPFITRMVLVSLVNLGSNLVDAGAACGGPLWRRILTLELPMLRPTLGNVTALCLILTAQEFGASILVRSTRTQVMSTVLYDQFANGSNSQVAVMAFLMCAITGISVLLALAIGRPSTPKEN